MNLYLYDDDEIILFSLPEKVIGNFWMTDSQGNNVVNISASDDKWIITSSNNTKILYNNNYVENEVLNNKSYYIIEKQNNKYVLFVDNLLDNTYMKYTVNNGIEIKVGSSSSCDICFRNGIVNDLHLILYYKDGIWSIKKDFKSIIYLNNKIILNDMLVLHNGDVLNIFGLRIITAFNMLIVNNPFNNLLVNNSILNILNISIFDQIVDEEILDLPLYRDDEYFLKSPRMRRSIQTFDMKIDSPPQKEDDKAMPLLYTLGPMLTMGASSVVSISDTLSKIASGERTMDDSLPSLIVSGAMLCSMLVWPFLTKSYEADQKRKKEKKRQLRYKAYISKKEKELQEEYKTQKQILEENLLSVDACYNIILNKQRVLWERKIEQSDFLTVRVGSGRLPFDANISYQSKDFSMDDDNLIKKIEDVIEKYSELDNVPIGYSFSENNITAINGVKPKSLYFIYNIILQMMAYHSYDNLKFVVFTNKKNECRWSFLKNSLYSFTDDKNMRLFAVNTEEMQEVSSYLEKIFQYRKDSSNVQNGPNKRAYSNFNSYYLFLIDDIDSVRKIGIINNILEEKSNFGFGMIILEDKLSKLPSQCTNFISIGDKVSGILKNDFVSNTQIKFEDEIGMSYDMEQCSYLLSNVPIYMESNNTIMPNTVTFLEMFGVGQVEQLNCLNRWKDNDPTKSLKTSVGLNENGDLFLLDLHEKQHGPHGLVAGMTGSGKSEFIITYILSMAVNYSPEEVSFVLIDYKGGGLAGAFENKELGIKLPHIVGTITNLDKTEINRALASIDSELKRRQAKFNEVRELTGESTVDIYKYQRMYREGIVDEPMPHLIIVSDEFAELKSQQPDFMDNLISTARIGRSLGVHLILATQKPSGVVDAQIWSNSKFKICLKVQDKSDSMEMIKCADAAELKNVGRFYLQVGYNEYFALGQSAWAGAQYFPSKEYKKFVDKNIYFIDNIGYVYKTIDNGNNKRSGNSFGEELANVLKYVINVSNTMNFKLRQLWKDKISTFIQMQNLIKKYNYNVEKYNLNPVIGEYDDPTTQSQGLLTIPITRDGNVVVYGMADSGRDEFLQSLVYSIMTTYSTEEVNMFLVDYGAETLINFNDVPHVGDVILNGDDEKLNNLIKMLSQEINSRKKKFVSYNGNYLDYIKFSGKTIPNILVIINVFEILTENYQDLFDILFPVIREGAKYGISFIMTTTNQSSMRFKVAQTCKQIYCLRLSNDSEYRDIFGGNVSLVPSKGLGRGLTKLDRVCEFQTFSIATDEEKFKVIKDTIEVLKRKGIKKAKGIPMMPDIIKLNSFEDYKDIKTIPIGIEKESLSPVLYDFSKNVVTLISSQEFNYIGNFINNFLKVLEMNNSFNKMVIDANNYFEDYNYNINLYTSNFGEVLTSLKSYDDEIQKILSENNNNVRCLKKISNCLCVIIGLEKFYGKLSDDEKKTFKEILSNNKEALKINFVFIDIPSGFKKYEYEDWYKNNVDNDDGIWIGSGVTQQFVIKLTVQLSKFSNVDGDYGILVKNGIPRIIKLINEIK